MQSNKKHSFVRRSPLAYVVVPLVFTAISAVIFFTTTKILLAPYQALISWVLTTTEAVFSASRSGKLCSGQAGVCL